MSRSLVDETETKADAGSQDISNLTRAFELFSQETARLEQAYTSLKKQFKRVNRELEETNHQLASILGNMTQGLLFVRMDGTVATANCAVERILGVSSAEITDLPFWDSFDDSVFGFSMKEVLESKCCPSLTTLTLQRNERCPVDLELDSNFVSTGEASHQGLIVLLRDITEVRQLQVLANRNDRMKELGEMAASIAHEIRNPLGGIKGFAGLLMRDLEDKPAMRDMAEYIVVGAQRLDKLVGSVLHYARPMPLHFAFTDLNPVIKELAALMGADEQYRERITVQTELPKGTIMAPVDVESMKAALLNLMVNAAQATQGQGKVQVTAATESQEVTLTVQDWGVGIPEENLEKIFSPFFTTKEEGNGFGLSEVHRIVQAHGGKIEVDSVVGEGTRFSITLPIRR